MRARARARERYARAYGAYTGLRGEGSEGEAQHNATQRNVIENVPRAMDESNTVPSTNFPS